MSFKPMEFEKETIQSDSDIENETKKESKQPQDKNEDSQNITIEEKKKDTKKEKNQLTDEEKEKIETEYNDFKKSIEKKLDQVERGVNGLNKFFQLINEIIPIYLDKRYSTKTGLSKKVIRDNQWDNWLHDVTLKKQFVLGVKAGQQEANYDSQQFLPHHVEPIYRPRHNEYNWPCRTTTGKELKNFVYCAGYMSGYYTYYNEENLYKEQQRTKWRNIKRKEQCPCYDRTDCVAIITPRWMGFNQFALGVKFLMQVMTDNVTVCRIGDIFVATILGGHIFVGIGQTFEEIIKLTCRKKHHKEIKKHNESFDERLSLRDTGCSKGTQSMLGILNSGGKVFLNGLALGFYIYTACNPSNNLFALISFNMIIGANVIGDIGNGVKDIVNTCINSKEDKNNKQIAPIQHCFTFFAKPLGNIIADGGSIALALLNYYNVILDTVAATGIVVLQFCKTGINYFSNMLANIDKYRNDSNEIFKIEVDKSRSKVDFKRVNKFFETDIKKVQKNIELEIKGKNNEKTPLLPKVPQGNSINQY
ncbi:MAG: hypothetical protein PVG30_07605 [Gammaproteobacteria bacterium]|jgi:hypothetical protein